MNLPFHELVRYIFIINSNVIVVGINSVGADIYTIVTVRGNVHLNVGSQFS